MLRGGSAAGAHVHAAATTATTTALPSTLSSTAPATTAASGAADDRMVTVSQWAAPGPASERRPYVQGTKPVVALVDDSRTRDRGASEYAALVSSTAALHTPQAPQGGARPGMRPTRRHSSGAALSNGHTRLPSSITGHPAPSHSHHNHHHHHHHHHHHQQHHHHEQHHHHHDHRHKHHDHHHHQAQRRLGGLKGGLQVDSGWHRDVTKTRPFTFRTNTLSHTPHHVVISRLHTRFRDVHRNTARRPRHHRRQSAPALSVDGRAALAPQPRFLTRAEFRQLRAIAERERRASVVQLQEQEEEEEEGAEEHQHDAEHNNRSNNNHSGGDTTEAGHGSSTSTRLQQRRHSSSSDWHAQTEQQLLLQPYQQQQQHHHHQEPPKYVNSKPLVSGVEVRRIVGREADSVGVAPASAPASSALPSTIGRVVYSPAAGTATASVQQQQWSGKAEALDTSAASSHMDHLTLPPRRRRVRFTSPRTGAVATGGPLREVATLSSPTSAITKSALRSPIQTLAGQRHASAAALHSGASSGGAVARSPASSPSSRVFHRSWNARHAASSPVITIVQPPPSAVVHQATAGSRHPDLFSPVHLIAPRTPTSPTAAAAKAAAAGCHPVGGGAAAGPATHAGVQPTDLPVARLQVPSDAAVRVQATPTLSPTGSGSGAFPRHVLLPQQGGKVAQSPPKSSMASPKPSVSQVRRLSRNTQPPWLTNA